MPAALLTKDQVIDRLFVVFRDQGYEGTSLATLSSATGLGRSSLYHYFPGGKEDMAAAVLDRALDWLDQNIAAVAAGPGSVSTRFRRIAAALDRLYDGGRDQCVLGRLSGDAPLPSLRARLNDAFGRWISALSSLAREDGLCEDDATSWAQDSVGHIQGALLLATATGSLAAFDRAMDALAAGPSVSAPPSRQSPTTRPASDATRRS